MTDRLDEEIKALVVKMMAMVPDSPGYPTTTVSRHVATKRRRIPGWVVAFAAAASVLVFVAIPVLLITAVDGEPPATADNSTTSATPPASRVPPDAATSMEIRPTTVSPGETIELSFLPEGGLRGVGYRLEARLVDGPWQPVAWLVAAAEGHSGAAQFGPWGEDVVFPEIRVAGLDPDIVVLPESLSAGRYRICDAFDWLPCAEFRVSGASSDAKTARCRDTAPQRPEEGETVIYVLCDLDPALPYPLIRQLTEGLDPINSAVMSLVRGTTDSERQAGLSVGFDDAPLDERELIQVGTDLDGDGVLHIEFLLQGGDWEPGQLASTSSQLISLIDPVFATVFQFREVAAIDLAGMCWGETPCTDVLKRTTWEEMVSINSGRDVGSGCGLIGAWLDPECGAMVP